MNSLNFTFECLDGNYHLNVCFDKTLDYSIETTIEGFTSISGSLDEKKTNEFIELLNEAHIETWEKEYIGSGIEDACKWNVKLIVDNKKYVSKGLESFEPYNYEYLIKALGLIEENYKYFLVNV